MDKLIISLITNQLNDRLQIELLVDKIIAAKKDNPHSDTSVWEKEIDELVYQLYELTEEEIGIIEKNISR